ncbi:MAG: HD domain-containing phosphohydrolase [Candidatus Kapaibacteriota bacterium]
MELSRIYILEDDLIQTTFISNVVSKFFPNVRIKTASKLSDIIDLLERLQFPAIFLIDVFLEDANGINVLKKIKQLHPNDIYFTIVMTSGDDPSIGLQALKAGADDFFQKPLQTENLITRLLNAKKFLMEKVEMKVLMEKVQNLEEENRKNRERMINLIVEFQNSKIPKAAKSTESIRNASVWITHQLAENPEEVERVELASHLAYAGKLFLSDNQINLPVMTNGFVTNENMNRVPEYTKELLSQVPNFEEIINILAHIYENFDGSGIPDKIKAWEIPLESRVLRVAIDYEYFLEKNQNKQNKAIELLFNEARRLYDFRVIAYYDQYLASLNLKGKSGQTREIPVLISELTPTMILSRNIFTQSGLKLVASGTRLSDEIIYKILNVNKEDGIIGNIYVYEPAKDQFHH